MKLDQAIRMAFVALVGTMTILHGSSVNAQNDLAIISAYKTDTAPNVDGIVSPGEWDAAGPAYVVSIEQAGTAFPDDPFGGPSDLSFQFRVMWEEPWTAYFLFEVTDDIDMEIIPANRWEMDQIEFFLDGDDLEGNAEVDTFQWWDNLETYGKFGASRFENEFEGNVAVMSSVIDDLYADGFGAYAVAVSGETGVNADYVVEYAVSLEPMFDNGVFDGTATDTAGQIVADETVIKWTSCVSDDDNFGDGTLGRSHTVCSYRAVDGADWRDSTAFADLVFVGPFGNNGVRGDFNSDGSVDAADIDALAAVIRDGTNAAAYDVNGDGSVNGDDRTVWVEEIKNTFFGDSNLDGEFNSTDFVAVFQAGEFEDGLVGNSTWATGDWNGDQEFSTGDFVLAFQAGGFETGPRAATASVPEPSSLVLISLAVFGLVRIRRREAVEKSGIGFQPVFN